LANVSDCIDAALDKASATELADAKFKQDEDESNESKESC
jgi:hypothetical protein